MPRRRARPLQNLSRAEPALAEERQDEMKTTSLLLGAGLFACALAQDDSTPVEPFGEAETKPVSERPEFVVRSPFHAIKKLARLMW
jgi:hypothetical protein